MPGTLFVVATPIGNLEDVSFRALRTLREVALIAAEDTRRTAKLLARYEIRKPLVSLREHNEARETPRLVARLAAGESIALVSDAGTPGISDPGARLVAAARNAGRAIIPVPGPSAVTAALSVSGFQAEPFVFLGFPPPKGAARRRWFEDVAKEARVLVFFESPHRIRRTVAELKDLLVNRQILVCREITKINESYAISPISAMSKSLETRGEYVLVVGPTEGNSPVVPPTAQVVRLLLAITESGVTPAEALSLTARALQLPEAVVAKIVKKHNILVKQQGMASP